ncbi:MAG: Dimethyl sulfoxide reductase DmsA precursor [Syntrophorhabdaceae bacterium PtaU1.Bin034]|nr:MAG: Dimethyl sulfoxide reductase DmsA precursor [Syntrophorhabdaceae bacterium PtaU1.Bin034]
MDDKWSLSREAYRERPCPSVTGAAASAREETTVITTSCSNNCGGRCILRVHVRGGAVIRIETDPSPDIPDRPALRACLRGRSYRQILYHPDRLKYPLKRVGTRGEGKFERISWDEATTIVAARIKRVHETYGLYSIYNNYARGVRGLNNSPFWVNRLISLYTGDYLEFYGTYSSGQTSYATPLTYGTVMTGSHRKTWQDSKLIILAGHNPAETVFGTNTMYYLRLAKEAGARIIAIDPRYTDTAIALADEWIPIRPTTDSALFAAMAQVMIAENLHDQRFLDTYCLGFDEEHLPEGTDPGESFKAYVLGQADGQAKTPEWAAPITGIPAERIRRLAREYATSKPAALIQGFGQQRHANGEQSVRAAAALACMTGNVGIRGGWASGHGGRPGSVAYGTIPIPGGHVKISCFIWTDAVVRGKEMTAEKDLIQGIDRLPCNIKMIINPGGNALINQHSHINRTRRILEDEDMVEFIVASDLFMTPSARFADILLPAADQFERENIVMPWGQGEHLIYMKRIVEPPGECRDEYEWLCEVAEKLGIGERFHEGKDIVGWLRSFTGPTAEAHPDFPGFDRFREEGVFRTGHDGPLVAFAAQIADPEHHKFATPSGKIEIFSRRLHDRNNPAEVPAAPRYVPAFDGPEDPRKERYPLQLTGWHVKRRVHSLHDNNPWMTEAGRQELWINPLDAGARGIADDDPIRVFNDRGVTLTRAKVTTRIMPGVVALPQGSWYTPDAEGRDTNGAINMLTTQRGSYMSNSNPQHTNLVEVEKA